MLYTKWTKSCLCDGASLTDSGFRRIQSSALLPRPNGAQWPAIPACVSTRDRYLPKSPAKAELSRIEVDAYQIVVGSIGSTAAGVAIVSIAAIVSAGVATAVVSVAAGSATGTGFALSTASEPPYHPGLPRWANRPLPFATGTSLNQCRRGVPFGCRSGIPIACRLTR